LLEVTHLKVNTSPESHPRMAEAEMSGEEPCPSKPRLTTLATACLVLVTVVPRLSTHTADMILNGDEAFSWRITAGTTLGELVRMTAEDVHPPLYYILLWGWIRVFGSSAIAMRTLSSVLGILIVPAVYLLTLSWMRGGGVRDRMNVSLLAGSLAAASLPLIAISHFVRMYALLTLLAVLSSASLSEAFRRPERPAGWIAYVTTASAALYTHNYALLLVAGQAIWATLEIWRSRGQGSRTILIPAASAFALVAALYLPWLPQLIWQSTVISRGYWTPRVNLGDIGSVLFHFLIAPGNLFREAAWYESLAGTAVAVAIFWPYRRTAGERLFWIIIISHVGLIVLSITLLKRAVLTPRFLVYLIPFVFPPIAYWTLRIRPAVFRRLLTGWFILFMLSITVSAFWLLPASSRGLRDAVAVFRELSAPGEPLVVSGPGAFLVASYYMGDDKMGHECRVIDPGYSSPESGHVVYSSAILPSERVSPHELYHLAPGGKVWCLAENTKPWYFKGWRTAYSQVFGGDDIEGSRYFLIHYLAPTTAPAAPQSPVGDLER